MSVDGSIVKGRRETILISFILRAPPGSRSSKEPTSILCKKTNREKNDDITFYLKNYMSKEPILRVKLQRSQ